MAQIISKYDVADVQVVYTAMDILPSFTITCKRHHFRIENVKQNELENIRKVLRQDCPECRREYRREHFTRHPLDPAYE